MPEEQNPYEGLHHNLVQQYDQLQELLRQKSDCLESVQQSKFPATQLPKIMQALQSQHEWELTMTEALGQLIEAVGVAVDEVNDGAEA